MFFCNMNCIKQFITFLILVLIRYASVRIKNEPEYKHVTFTKPNN